MIANRLLNLFFISPQQPDLIYMVQEIALL